MDTSQIITQVVIALITIVTTIVITKLSHGTGNLGITSKLKGTFTPKVRAYMNLLFAAVMCFWSAALVYRLVVLDSPLMRLEVLFMILNTLGVLGFAALTAKYFVALLILISRERHERDLALIRRVSGAHEEAWKPLADRAKELTERLSRMDEEDAARRVAEGQPPEKIEPPGPK